MSNTFYLIESGGDMMGAVERVPTAEVLRSWSEAAKAAEKHLNGCKDPNRSIEIAKVEGFLTFDIRVEDDRTPKENQQ